MKMLYCQCQNIHHQYNKLMGIRIPHLAIEVTRRCNIQCNHCIKGYAENRNIPLSYIDILLDQISSIGHFCPTGGEPSLNIPAIQYFIDGCKRRDIPIETMYISTNGININNKFIDVCLELYEICTNKMNSGVQVSNDKYHLKKGKYDDDLLSCLPFYSKRYEEGSNMRGIMVYEGLAAINDISFAIRRFKSKVGIIYLNAEGSIIDGDCWSYDNQEDHRLCRVGSLTKYLKTKEMEEDYERLSDTDKMYLLAKEREIQDEWMQWEDEQERKPAKIVVNMPVVKEVIKR